MKLYYLRFLTKCAVGLGIGVLRIGKALMAIDSFNVKLSRKFNAFVTNKLTKNLKAK